MGSVQTSVGSARQTLAKEKQRETVQTGNTLKQALRKQTTAKKKYLGQVQIDINKFSQQKLIERNGP